MIYSGVKKTERGQVGVAVNVEKKWKNNNLCLSEGKTRTLEMQIERDSPTIIDAYAK